MPSRRVTGPLIYGENGARTETDLAEILFVPDRVPHSMKEITDHAYNLEGASTIQPAVFCYKRCHRVQYSIRQVHLKCITISDFSRRQTM